MNFNFPQYHDCYLTTIKLPVALRNKIKQIALERDLLNVDVIPVLLEVAIDEYFKRKKEEEKLIDSFYSESEAEFAFKKSINKKLKLKLQASEILSPVEKDISSFVRPSGQSKTKEAQKRWTRKYENCQKCHTTKRRHQGHGLCSRCYQELRNKEHVSSDSVQVKESKIKSHKVAHSGEAFCQNPGCLDKGKLFNKDEMIEHNGLFFSSEGCLEEYLVANKEGV